jgi:hypothetical protein
VVLRIGRGVDLVHHRNPPGEAIENGDLPLADLA